ncbi:DEAD/DEAH box helicase [Methanomethylovorans sp.]|uniref:DEAD/DEAH box helicase n=1 Tax=Methanomethylovorans sp. TaxID=2758717 RepID=UPI00351C2750
MGFVDPTPIQVQAIPYILEGKDVIGQAETGTGKTAAFGIPALEMVNINQKKVQALVLCPTRELANQVAAEMNLLSRYKDIKIQAIYGGQAIERQIRTLKKGVHIVIGTPGRVMDHLERNTLKLDNLKMLVLDEADKMLDMGFREDIELILNKAPERRQTILFSATMPKPIMKLTTKYQHEPLLVKTQQKNINVPQIEQFYFDTKGRSKHDILCRVIDNYDMKSSLVFCNTKKGVDELVGTLRRRGYLADGLHGDMGQRQRDEVMSGFRNGTIETLVATDVASRGIDVKNIEAVFNYDIPQDTESYIHRIGRTGRAGKEGRAFTFAASREVYRIKNIQKYTNTVIRCKELPSAA